MSQKRISYIDMAKGIGILLVLIGHSEFPSTNLITWISSFHMPLFFILSGMLFSHTNIFQKEWKVFVQKKAKSILIPYVAFSILSILASAILDFSSFPEYLWTSLLQTISLYGISVLWFLPTLFISEIAFFFIKQRTSPKTAVFVNLVVGVLAICGNELYHRYYTVTDDYLTLFLSYLLTVLIRSGIAITFLAIGYYIYRPLSAQKHYGSIYLVRSSGFLLLNIFIIDSNTILVRPIPKGEYSILFVFMLGSNSLFKLTITSCVDILSMLRNIVGISIILEHSKDNSIGPTIDIVLDIIVFNVGLFILCKYLYIEYIIITMILSKEYFKLVIILKNKDIISK